MAEQGDEKNGKAHVRKRPALFRALGDDDPPSEVLIGGVPYERITIYKHDSWAATACYANASGEKAVCKFNRRQPIFIIPMVWLGRGLASREAGFLKRLSDVELVPRDLGEVIVDGKVLRYAMARTHIEGEPFRRPDQVDARFFEDLRRTLDQIHAHDVAYVDLHKRENILISEDGRPYFLDFQVGYGLGSGWLHGGRLARYVLGQLRELDDYHVRKHIAKCMPETLTPQERARYLQLTPLVRVHRKIARPLKYLRLKLLIALHIRDATGSVESEYEPEIAFRTPAQDDSLGPDDADRPSARSLPVS